MKWQTQAAAWLRAKATEQSQINERYPKHAACYPSWVDRVKIMQRLAEELERDANDVQGSVPP